MQYHPENEIENELLEAWKTLAAFNDNAPMALFLKDTQGRFCVINKLSSEWCGVTEKDVIGKTSYDLYPAEYANLYNALDQKVLSEGRVLHQEAEVPFADGELHIAEVIKFPIYGSNGCTLGVGTINTDP